MKKTYAKPTFLKKGRLSAITAGNGASIILPG
ncbi:putative RiPP precursor [Mesorhizobium cantuariense]|uniref:RiPP n=1 Tax=Mesorhizobium cantuariense TaxID=1300275 RepID=A0ABV7MRC8_9HYPH